MAGSSLCSSGLQRRMEKEAAGEVGSADGGGGAECERVLRSNESGRAGVALEWQ